MCVGLVRWNQDEDDLIDGHCVRASWLQVILSLGELKFRFEVLK